MAARPPYQESTDAEGDRHAAFGLELMEAMAADDRKRAADLMARLYHDPDINPWTLVLAVLALAVKRPRVTCPEGR